jgi:hypothetical protein
MQMPQSVQSSWLTVTTSLIMLIAMAGQRLMHAPQLVHFSLSIFTMATPFLTKFLTYSIIRFSTVSNFGTLKKKCAESQTKRAKPILLGGIRLGFDQGRYMQYGDF